MTQDSQTCYNYLLQISSNVCLDPPHHFFQSKFIYKNLYSQWRVPVVGELLGYRGLGYTPFKLISNHGEHTYIIYQSLLDNLLGPSLNSQYSKASVSSEELEAALVAKLSNIQLLSPPKSSFLFDSVSKHSSHVSRKSLLFT
jgi:hypothetical protein